nr:WYL domain-containing protein [Micromonospora sp. DSM 115978]
VTELDEGRLRVALFASDLGWLRRLVLGLGAEVRVVEPAELADDVRSSARRTLDAYAELDRDRPTTVTVG